MQMTNATFSSSGAGRARLYRQRRAEGRHVARIEIGPEEIEALVENSLLEPGKSSDRAAIIEAIDCLLYALFVGAVEIDWDQFGEEETEPEGPGEPARYA